MDIITVKNRNFIRTNTPHFFLKFTFLKCRQTTFNFTTDDIRKTERLVQRNKNDGNDSMIHVDGVAKSCNWIPKYDGSGCGFSRGGRRTCCDRQHLPRFCHACQAKCGQHPPRLKLPPLGLDAYTTRQDAK